MSSISTMRLCGSVNKCAALLFVAVVVSGLLGCGRQLERNGFDYQIGGAYDPPAGTRYLARDRGAKPVKGLFNICYVNAFQAQPEEVGWWRRTHPDLLLSRDGDLVVDEFWDEPLLDISTPTKRAALLGVVGAWMDGCARAGFQAVEPDNLDSFTRSDGLLTVDDADAFAGMLAERAHDLGLQIGQKNTVELVGRVRFDFAVVEECQEYDECGVYTRAYKRVLEIEYTRKSFEQACAARRRQVSLVLRDREVHAEGEPGYVFERCQDP